MKNHDGDPQRSMTDAFTPTTFSLCHQNFKIFVHEFNFDVSNTSVEFSVKRLLLPSVVKSLD